MKYCIIIFINREAAYTHLSKIKDSVQCLVVFAPMLQSIREKQITVSSDNIVSTFGILSFPSQGAPRELQLGTTPQIPILIHFGNQNSHFGDQKPEFADRTLISNFSKRNLNFFAHRFYKSQCIHDGDHVS